MLPTREIRTLVLNLLSLISFLSKDVSLPPNSLHRGTVCLGSVVWTKEGSPFPWAEVRSANRSIINVSLFILSMERPTPLLVLEKTCTAVVPPVS